MKAQHVRWTKVPAKDFWPLACKQYILLPAVAPRPFHLNRLATAEVRGAL